MKEMKHLFIAILFLCVGVMEGYAFYQGGLYYNITSATEKTVEVIKYQASSSGYPDSSYDIPESVIYGDITYKVTSIGNDAFRNCSRLRSIKLPTGMTSVGDNAFNNCYRLSTIEFPEGLISIGNYAFQDCDSLSSVIFPAGLTSIGDYAFASCYKLSAVKFPAGLTSIGDYAFAYCRELSSIDELPEDLKSIGSRVFYECIGAENMTCIKLPNGIENIGAYVFGSTNKISSVTIPASVLNLTNDAFPNAKKIIFLGNTPPKGITKFVADGRSCYVSSKATYGFGVEYANLSSLFEVGGVKYVLVSAKDRSCDVIDCVYNSTSESIIVDSLVTYRNIKLKVRNINDYAFYENDLIRSVVIKNNGYVGDYAFYGCDSIENATLGYSVDSIYSNAFAMCTTLSEIQIPNNVPYLGENCFEGCSSLNKAVVGRGVKVLNPSTFRNCTSMREVEVGENVALIDTEVFNGCSSLLSITIPKATKEIRDNVFTKCQQLSEVIIADRTDSITLGNKCSGKEYYALFADCKLDSVYIGGKLLYDNTKLKEFSPFYGNQYLRSVAFNDVEKTIYDHEFANCSNLQNVVFGKGITSIGKAAFANCSELPSVAILDEVVNIGGRCFYNCSSLKSAQIGTGVKTLEWGAFENCSSLTDMQIGMNVELIAKSVFRGCTSLPQITIPQATQTISDSVFYNCTSLANVIIEDRTTTLNLGSNGYSNSSSATSSTHPLFHSCPLDSVYIGGKIQYNTSAKYGFSPFFRNKSLRTVVVADSETEVYDNEFYGCTGLTDVVLGDGVTRIGDWAFSGCISLTNFAFGNSVQTIGKEAFSDCTSMVKLVSSCNVPPVCGEQALADIDVWNCTLYVPNDYIDDYYWAEQWWDFFFIDGAEYKVTFVLGEDKYSEMMVKYGDQIDLPTPVKEGYTFQGWNDVPATMPADNITLYGSFTPNEYIITYVVDGEVYETEAIACDAVITPIIAPSKEDYTFSYWENLPETMPSGNITVTAVYVDKVKEVQVVINQYGSGTYCSEYALDFSNVNGLKAYAATGFNTSTQVVTMTRMNTSEAGVGLFIKGEPGTYTVPVIDASNDNSLNMLVGTLDKIMINGMSNDGAYTNFKYTVTSGNNTPMFYQFTDGSSFSGGKAYLQIPTEWLPVMPSKTIKIKFDDGYTTDIEGIIDNGKNTIVYDLNGKQVMTPTKGLYIINGKKVLKK